MNILWIMCDQLRFDYLGCAGHPHIKTPHIDRLAREGVRFDQAFVQSTICGPSRMSAYTGRYVRSHGSRTNGSPLRVGEPTLGDHLREIGVDPVLIGKTHMTADAEGMARLGIASDSEIGVRTAECGFIPYLRDDGYHPHGTDLEPAYFQHLRDNGLEADNPWEDWANAAEGEGPEKFASGWFMRHARKPARVPAHLSESAYITDCALEFMASVTSERPWMAHVSYIKPHWPYIAPAPYHEMYGSEQVLPVIRSEAERNHPHSIFRAFQQERFSQVFHRDEVRNTVIPTYMGLISEIDDHIGRIVHWLKEHDRYDDTMIVISSDHGDFLGDHWLGEKQMFHDPSVRVPLIIRDPRATANRTRGTVSQDLVELIDLAPTFLDAHGADTKPHILEGLSLMPILNGEDKPDWRKAAFSEYDYSGDLAFRVQDSAPPERAMRMVVTQDWKLMQFEGFAPMLFDRNADPQELHDLASSAEHAEILAELHELLFIWARNPKSDICTAESRAVAFAETLKSYDAIALMGAPIGYWHEDELKVEMAKAVKTVSKSS